MQRNISNVLQTIRQNAAFVLVGCIVAATIILLFTVGQLNSETPKKPGAGQSVPAQGKSF